MHLFKLHSAVVDAIKHANELAKSYHEQDGNAQQQSFGSSDANPNPLTGKLQATYNHQFEIVVTLLQGLSINAESVARVLENRHNTSTSDTVKKMTQDKQQQVYLLMMFAGVITNPTFVKENKGNKFGGLNDILFKIANYDGLINNPTYQEVVKFTAELWFACTVQEPITDMQDTNKPFTFIAKKLAELDDALKLKLQQLQNDTQQGERSDNANEERHDHQREGDHGYDHGGGFGREGQPPLSPSMRLTDFGTGNNSDDDGEYVRDGEYDGRSPTSNVESLESILQTATFIKKHQAKDADLQNQEFLFDKLAKCISDKLEADSGIKAAFMQSIKPPQVESSSKDYENAMYVVLLFTSGFYVPNVDESLNKLSPEFKKAFLQAIKTLKTTVDEIKKRNKDRQQALNPKYKRAAKLVFALLKHMIDNTLYTHKKKQGVSAIVAELKEIVAMKEDDETKTNSADHKSRGPDASEQADSETSTSVDDVESEPSKPLPIAQSTAQPSIASQRMMVHLMHGMRMNRLRNSNNYNNYHNYHNYSSNRGYAPRSAFRSISRDPRSSGRDPRSSRRLSPRSSRRLSPRSSGSGAGFGRRGSRSRNQSLGGLLDRRAEYEGAGAGADDYRMPTMDGLLRRIAPSPPPPLRTRMKPRSRTRTQPRSAEKFEPRSKSRRQTVRRSKAQKFASSRRSQSRRSQKTRILSQSGKSPSSGRRSLSK